MPEYKVGDVIQVIKTDPLDNLVGIHKGDNLVVREVDYRSGVFVDYKNGRSRHLLLNDSIKLVKRGGEI